MTSRTKANQPQTFSDVEQNQEPDPREPKPAKLDSIDASHKITRLPDGAELQTWKEREDEWEDVLPDAKPLTGIDRLRFEYVKNEDGKYRMRTDGELEEYIKLEGVNQILTEQDEKEAQKEKADERPFHPRELDILIALYKSESWVSGQSGDDINNAINKRTHLTCSTQYLNENFLSADKRLRKEGYIGNAGKGTGYYLTRRGRDYYEDNLDKENMSQQKQKE